MSHTIHKNGELPGIDVKGIGKIAKELRRRARKRFPVTGSVWRGNGVRTKPVIPK